MIGKFIHDATPVIGILYIVIGGGLLASAGIVWLSRALNGDPWRIEP